VRAAFIRARERALFVLRTCPPISRLVSSLLADSLSPQDYTNEQSHRTLNSALDCDLFTTTSWHTIISTLGRKSGLYEFTSGVFPSVVLPLAAKTGHRWLDGVIDFEGNRERKREKERNVHGVLLRSRKKKKKRKKEQVSSAANGDCFRVARALCSREIDRNPEFATRRNCPRFFPSRFIRSQSIE
jgi:hypothetical protein